MGQTERDSIPNLAVLIKHHPERAHLLPALTQSLEPLPTTVVTDHGANEPRRSCWRCFKACLEAIPEDASHVAIIEDDVTVCDDFAAGLERIVEARPNDLLALWVSKLHGQAAGGVRAGAGARRGRSTWVRLKPSCVPVVALLFPLELAERLREWAALNPVRLGGDDDNRAITAFIRDERIDLLAPLPSLVEHPDVERSVLTGERGRGRTGYLFIGSRSPLSIDWGPALEAPIRAPVGAALSAPGGRG